MTFAKRARLCIRLLMALAVAPLSFGLDRARARSETETGPQEAARRVNPEAPPIPRLVR
jgi:hypothetical protein